MVYKWQHQHFFLVKVVLARGRYLCHFSFFFFWVTLWFDNDYDSEVLFGADYGFTLQCLSVLFMMNFIFFSIIMIIIPLIVFHAVLQCHVYPIIIWVILHHRNKVIPVLIKNGWIELNNFCFNYRCVQQRLRLVALDPVWEDGFIIGRICEPMWTKSCDCGVSEWKMKLWYSRDIQIYCNLQT